MYCRKCGKELPDDSLFCLYCGVKIESASESSVLLQEDSAIKGNESVNHNSVEEPISEESIIEKDSPEQSIESKSLSDLINELSSLSNAKDIYIYVSEHTEACGELLNELEKIKELERMYGNKKEKALSKVREFYDTNGTIAFKTITNEMSIQNQMVPPEIKEVPTVTWYYVMGNERKGPVTDSEIKDLIKRGVIDRGTMVWKEGFNGWVKAEDTELKYNVDSVVPATPTNAISDKWLWALSTVPMLCDILLSLFIPRSASMVITVIVIVLNIVFLSLDTKSLRESGYNPESWLWLGIILVPVYLFVRAAKTTKNMAPGIVWCVIFVLNIFI